MEKKKESQQVGSIVVVAFAVLVCIPGIIFLTVSAIEGHFPNWKALSSEEWISLISGAVTYIGTCGMGVIALWQNQKVHNINSRMMDLEEKKMEPALDIFVEKMEQSEYGQVLTDLTLGFCNVGDTVVRHLSVMSITIKTETQGEAPFSSERYVGDIRPGERKLCGKRTFGVDLEKFNRFELVVDVQYSGILEKRFLKRISAIVDKPDRLGNSARLVQVSIKTLV